MAARRGRSPGFLMTDEHRIKIKNSKILNVLVDHIEGRRELVATQVTAALGLLKKVMPDLSSIEHKTEAPLANMSDEELRQLIDQARYQLAQAPTPGAGSGTEAETRH